MATQKNEFFAVIRPDLIWFLLGDIVAETLGLFSPNYEGDAEPLHQIYVAIQKAIEIAAASGELPVRAWPLWNRVPYTSTDDDAIYGISVTDLHEWLQHTRYPTAKTPEALLGVFKARWATMQDAPEIRTTTQLGASSFEEIGFSDLVHGEKTAWFKEKSEPYIRMALEQGVSSDRRSVTEWVCKNIPAANGTNPGQWNHYMTREAILRIREQMQREIVKN